MPAYGKVQPVGEEGVELYPQKTPFRQQRTVLLDRREKMRRSISGWAPSQ